MSGIIDIVCNLYTPRTVAEGRTGLDDAFRDQVRMPEDMRGGVEIADYVARMDCAGIERSLLVAVRAGQIGLPESFEVPYMYVREVCEEHPTRFSGLAGIDPTRGMAGLKELEYAVKELGFVGAHWYPHWFALEKAALAKHATPALKTIISNAAALPQATKERIVDHFGDGILHETYGSTEAGIVCNLRPADQLRKQRSVGQPFTSTEVRLLDENGEVGPGEVGELFSNSPFLFNGYWRKPRETAGAFRDGWVSVGDLARRDEEGYIYIVDRKKDMVISGGVNIFPREVEEELLRHPDILDAAVVGVPDERWGESLKAFVVLRAGLTLDAEELAAFCEGRLARFKIPRTVETLPALPRNAYGKVLKGELRNDRPA